MMIWMLMRQSIRLIRVGAEDKRIYKEYIRSLRRGKKSGWFSKIIAVLFACVVACVFGFTMYLQMMEKEQVVDTPIMRVVYSESMSAKHEKNTYLVENNLNDQFSRFDLIVTHRLPAEEDLKLYDIVVYEVNKVLVVHRIVGIEEPNEKHPDHRLFQLQGDNVTYPDRDPVRYEQMRAIYRGKHVKYVGSCIIFLQSPAGYMCFLLLVIEMLASPLMEKRLRRAEKRRLKITLQEHETELASIQAQYNYNCNYNCHQVPFNKAQYKQNLREQKRLEKEQARQARYRELYSQELYSPENSRKARRKQARYDKETSYGSAGKNPYTNIENLYCNVENVYADNLDSFEETDKKQRKNKKNKKNAPKAKAKNKNVYLDDVDLEFEKVHLLAQEDSDDEYFRLLGSSWDDE
jgi:hypothetical protein